MSYDTGVNMSKETFQKLRAYKKEDENWNETIRRIVKGYARFKDSQMDAEEWL